MSCMSSHEALQLTASFLATAERMRSHSDSCRRASLYEIASRIAFLRAHMIARNEEVRPVFGQSFRPAAFATA
jgi:hypothetical protein